MSDKIIIEDKKILVTGGAGFIGSNLCESLLSKRNKVVCLDNLSTGFIKNIEHLFENVDFKFIEGDIRNYEDCQKAVEDIDIVLHQAALGSVPRSIKDPITSIDVNIGGFTKILFAAKEAGVKRFVYAASSSTYGDSKNLPKVEHIIGNPLSPYAITKYTDEQIAENFSDIYGIETIGLRYFNVFGRKQDPNGPYAAVIPLFIKKFLNHEPPVINGDGSFSRDFTYIENVINANILAATLDSETLKNRLDSYYSNNKIDSAVKNTIGEVFNVAQGQRTDLNKLADMIQKSLSITDYKISNVKVIHGPERAGDIPHSHASINKSIEVLGYKSNVLIDKGIEEVCRWYIENKL